MTTMTQQEVRAVLGRWIDRDWEAHRRWKVEDQRIWDLVAGFGIGWEYLNIANDQVFVAQIAASRVLLMEDLRGWPSARTALWSIKHNDRDRTTSTTNSFYRAVWNVSMAIEDVLDWLGAPTDSPSDLALVAYDRAWCKEIWGKIVQPALQRGLPQ
jgi:hypothetical protein